MPIHTCVYPIQYRFIKKVKNILYAVFRESLGILDIFLSSKANNSEIGNGFRFITLKMTM